jgi:hypothetical protein
MTAVIADTPYGGRGAESGHFRWHLDALLPSLTGARRAVTARQYAGNYGLPTPCHGQLPTPYRVSYQKMRGSRMAEIIDPEILAQAAESMRSNYGDVSDLPPELVNTLANVHYRVHELARARMPSTPDAFEALSRAIARYGPAAKHAPGMVKEARAAHSDPEVFGFIVGHMIDTMKYRMDSEFAFNRTEAERARRRDPSKVDEIPDLSARMGLTKHPAPRDPNPGPTDSETIVTAIESGNLESLRRFLKTNPSAVDAKHQPHGWTLLHHLAALGSKTLPVHSRMADELIRAGADVNCRTILSWTPIHLIAMQGQKESVELAKVLIAHGADLAAIDNHGADWKIHWQHGQEIRDVLEDASRR